MLFLITKGDKKQLRIKRHLRVRKKIQGTTVRPRLNIFRSEKHMYAQIIDDISAKTIVSASTLDKDIKSEISNGANIDSAKKVGQLIAQRAIQAGISKVVFDRGGYLFHGRVEALASAAREAGLEF
jgi:large subunit ribosomal protein L18